MPAIIAYLQIVLFPIWTANFFIVAYVVLVVVLFVKGKSGPGSFHYIQHVVLCLLFMALGVYL